VNVEVFVEGEDRGEALLADRADERLRAVGQTTVFHHLAKQYLISLDFNFNGTFIISWIILENAVT
jgi:hypothetical protein